MTSLKNRMQFEDGSELAWIDRESLRYEERGYVALVWVDFGPGFFSRTKVIKLSSIANWHEKPEGQPDVISAQKQLEIVEKVRKYYSGRPVVVE